MTIHYHGTPITPTRILNELAGGHFCVSFAQPQQIEQCHKIGQSVMIDNGAFSVWKRGIEVDWNDYYSFADPWLDCPTTWAVIPDVIEGDEDANNALLDQWPHGRDRGAPVWHMHEHLERLCWMIDEYPRVCIGSSGRFAEVMSASWARRMDAAWREIDRHFRRTPNVHMLRGMRLIEERWPFASLDSTNIARNHAGNKSRETPAKDAARMRHSLDALQCPHRFADPGEQMELEVA